MNDIIYNYIVQAILGAASGYITNDYAINMLFKEYTPLKIGGVIKKTRTEFIDKLSSLVENDIINREKLNKVLSGDEFITEFAKVTQDFFEKYLYEAVGASEFSQLNGIEPTINETGKFIEELLENHRDEIISLLIKNLNTEAFFTENQIDTLSCSLSESIIEAADMELSAKAISSLYNEKESVTLSELLCIPDERLRSISKNLVSELNSLITGSLSDKTEADLKDIYKILNIDNAFLAAKNAFFEKSLNDILNIDNELKDKALVLFTQNFNSEAGQGVLYDLCESLFLYLRKIDKTLFEITDSSFEINLKDHLLESLPGFTDKIISWVTLNGNNIDRMLEESIDELIGESDKIKAMLLSAIKSNYLDNLSEKYNVAGKIADFIKKEADAEKLSTSVSKKIIEYLNSRSIGGIVSDLEDSGILNPSKAAGYITEYINNYASSVFTEFLGLSKNIKIRSIISEGFIDKKQDDTREIISSVIAVIKEKILSSAAVNDMLSERMYILLVSLMNKGLNEIIPEDKAVADLKELVNKNTGSIRELLKNELSKVSMENLNLPNDSTAHLHNLVSDEIMKQYHIYADRAKEIKVSSALDAINKLDNLNENSAEMIRSAVTKNLDTIMEGSIKSAVSENLNKLSDDELVDLANDFIGRELQPIMYFGGVLGAIAGIILALIQNAPMDYGFFTIENMVTYALVGYLTNVIAINMIFKPYRENRLLSRLPFFKNFSIGYIVKNQKVFAKTTAHFVDNNLLSSDSINKLFEKHQESIKSSLISGIKSGDYGLLQKLLNNNTDKIVSGAYSFTKNSIDENKGNLSSLAFKSTEKINASSLLTPAAVNYLSTAGINKLMHEKENLTVSLYDHLSSGDSLKAQIPESIINPAKLYLNNAINQYYDATMSKLDSLDAIKAFTHRYNHNYLSFTDRYINEIAGSESVELFVKYGSEKISDFIFSQDSRKIIMDAANSCFAKSYSKNIGEAFGGKIKEYAENNAPLLFDRVFGYIKQEIIQSEKKISLSVQEEIKNSLSTIEKGMFALMGGKDIIDRLIHKIMVVKAPLFVDEKRHELYGIFSDTILKSFYAVKIEDIHKSLSKIQLDNLADSYFSDENNRRFVGEKITLIADVFKDKIGNIKLNSILRLVSLENTDSMFNAYGNEIQEFFSCLSSEMSDKKDTAINKIKFMSDEIIEEFTGSVSFTALYGELYREDIARAADNLSSYLTQDDYLKNLLVCLINNYKDYIGAKKLSEFIDKNKFISSVNIFIEDALKNEKIEESIKDMYLSALEEACRCNFNFIDDRTKSCIIDIIVDSGVKSIKGKLDSILKSMEFEHIAKEEIENMEPRKIHEMFDSFMGKYFKRLMLYGFGGFVFGINMYVGLSLTALKILSEKFSKK